MATLSESGQYVITPQGDVYDKYTGQHIDQPTFQSLGLNAALLPKVAQTPTGPNTGNQVYDQLLGELNDYLNKLKANGQTINPNVQIDPSKVAEFTSQAQSQIHPYYATQLKTASDQFLKGLGYSTADLAANEAQNQAKYGQDLRTLASNEAEKGFAQSGIRTLDENNLANSYQNTLDTNRRSLDQTANNAASTFAQKFGYDALNGVQVPQIGASPRVLSGNPNFDTSGQSRSLYQLSPNVYQGLIGSEQNAEKSATDTLASNLTQNYTQQQANNQTRQLIQ